ncbi:PTS sugar transporter subunit IIA [Candidatus Poribacteria bacterium]|jgi:mannitol/fructose-specific phosphotransferase system IIA component (Ntr-type)|nr:PTS sugar transporter subunit IIA [Candidatus Poribacteria bacterium]MBT5536819.1 PTS sugar transporter subunit IIA [Candidatus Poribacteria bacterium]MBT5710931.1 PTS sugar transporter subunit IIA [Candidatus Poribacteria bacterium]MBT7098083.1 PTS sugar transporter subunit IIA [Candidatus Poribacteria bacterium]
MADNEPGPVLHGLVEPSRVLVADSAVDKWDAIRQLVDLCVDAGGVAHEQRESALNAVYDRERRASTGLGHGCAIPHGVWDAAPREIGTLGFFPNGVDFQSTDGSPTHFVLMLLYPMTERDAHVQNLANAARLLSSAEGERDTPPLEESEQVYDWLARQECERRL